MLAGLITIIIRSSEQYSSFPLAMTGGGGSFYGLTTTLMLIGAVALVLTSERARASAFPVVLTAMIMVGVGLLFCLISAISGFVDVNDGGIAFAGFLSTAASGTVLGFFGFYLIKIFNDPTVVPRAQPQQQMYNQQQFPPATGAQQSFAQPGYPVADPMQTGAPQQAYGQDAYGQQAAYGQDAAAQQQAYGTGAQQAYGQDAAAQGYDPAQYAPQTYEGQPAADQQAQDAIQHGWYQDPAQQGQTPAEPGVEPFFNSGENTGTETPDQNGGSYGNQYESGSSYGSDQQGQGGTDNQQNWYGNDGQR
jgi:hypothetical protein